MLYNEIDPYAAQWLRNLISAGNIERGYVDERSIIDVSADDVAGYRQCHFFAGIGGWSRALKLAGWPDDWPVWTGSPPCQPFSVAGKGRGFDDERHLWPAWFRLIEQCRPPVIFGEQVDAAIRHGWLDLVQDGLEELGYSFAAVGLPAACVGAPHIRHRLWFVAYAGEQRRYRKHALLQRQGQEDVPETSWSGEAGYMGETNIERLERRIGSAERCNELTSRPPSLAGFWRNAEWLPCRDGKWRPVEPGTFPLAHGLRNRVGRLRAYGNAIVPQVAAEVVKVMIDWLQDII